MASKKPQKPKETEPVEPSPTSKITLVALKSPSPQKAQEPKELSSQIEAIAPPAPVEPPVPGTEKKILKPIKKSPKPPAEFDSSLPVQENPIFQGVGIIAGEVAFSDSDKKAHIKISDKQYPLFYAFPHKKAFEALRLEIKNTGQSRQRLVVYPKIIHFPKKEQPYLIGFQVVGFEKNLEKNQTENHENFSLNRELQDFEFKLSGLWQFIPVCQIPCITVQKNFSEERLAFVKEVPIERKVGFMRSSHIPVMWRDAPIRPFRFNPKLDKQQQGQAFFVEIKAVFIPDQDIFEFRELRSRPSQDPPKSLKAGKKQKAEATKVKNNRKKENARNSPKS